MRNHLSIALVFLWSGLLIGCGEDPGVTPSQLTSKSPAPFTPSPAESLNESYERIMEQLFTDSESRLSQFQTALPFKNQVSYHWFSDQKTTPFLKEHYYSTPTRDGVGQHLLVTEALKKARSGNRPAQYRKEKKALDPSLENYRIAFETYWKPQTAFFRVFQHSQLAGRNLTLDQLRFQFRWMETKRVRLEDGSTGTQLSYEVHWEVHSSSPSLKKGHWIQSMIFSPQKSLFENPVSYWVVTEEGNPILSRVGVKR